MDHMQPPRLFEKRRNQQRSLKFVLGYVLHETANTTAPYSPRSDYRCEDFRKLTSLGAIWVQKTLLDPFFLKFRSSCQLVYTTSSEKLIACAETGYIHNCSSSFVK
jgi:hypothetical protein